MPKPELDDSVMTIASVPSKPFCVVTWGKDTFSVKHEDMRVIALSLLTCSMLADVLIAMVSAIGLSGPRAADFVTKVANEARIAYGGVPGVLEINPVGSSKSGGGVRVVRGKREDIITSETAQELGVSWLEAKCAAEGDALYGKAMAKEALANRVISAVFHHASQMRQSIDQERWGSRVTAAETGGLPETGSAAFPEVVIDDAGGHIADPP